MDQSVDRDQISNYPEDHVEGQQGGTKPLSEEHAETVKGTLDHKAKIDHTAPTLKAGQITDPPEHDPGKKTEGTDKSG